MGEMSVARTSFLREHFFWRGGRLLFRDSTLAGCLAPAVPLKWAMAPPAGQLIISRCPLHPSSQPPLSVSISCCTSLWFSGQTLSPEDLVQLPSASPALASGRCTRIFVPSGSPSYSHSHFHSGHASSCKLPASYDSQGEFSDSLQSLESGMLMPALCFSYLAFQRSLLKPPSVA